jgi:shikimate kinase
VEQQLARTRRGTDRPLLNNADPRGTLMQLFKLRAPLYLEVAEFVVDTDGRKVRASWRTSQLTSACQNRRPGRRHRRALRMTSDSSKTRSGPALQARRVAHRIG